jgi:hypothetical protein
MTCYIKENSWIAKLAAKKLKAKTVAIVVGRTIHLHNATRRDLLQNPRWLRHEIRHVLQFRQHGLIPFMVLYLFESIKNGYRNNKYELEARASEKDESIITHVTLR